MIGSLVDISSMLQHQEDDTYEPPEGMSWYEVENYRAVHFQHRSSAERIHVPLLPSIDSGRSNQRMVLGILDK